MIEVLATLALLCDLAGASVAVVVFVLCLLTMLGVFDDPRISL